MLLKADVLKEGHLTSLLNAKFSNVLNVKSGRRSLTF
jgi:hypothetical protein